MRARRDVERIARSIDQSAHGRKPRKVSEITRTRRGEFGRDAPSHQPRLLLRFVPTPSRAGKSSTTIASGIGATEGSTDRTDETFVAIGAGLIGELLTEEPGLNNDETRGRLDERRAAEKSVAATWSFRSAVKRARCVSTSSVIVGRPARIRRPCWPKLGSSRMMGVIPSRSNREQAARVEYLCRNRRSPRTRCTPRSQGAQLRRIPPSEARSCDARAPAAAT